MFNFAKRYFAQLDRPLVPECDPTTGCNSGDLAQLAVNVIQFLINISLIIAVVFIMWGGFLLLTSGGSPERRSRGKKAITYAVVGVVIVILASTIINIFLELFTNCTGNWWDFQPLSC